MVNYRSSTAAKRTTNQPTWGNDNFMTSHKNIQDLNTQGTIIREKKMLRNKSEIYTITGISGRHFYLVKGAVSLCDKCF